MSILVKKSVVLILLMMVAKAAITQVKYHKIGHFDEYKTDWALVKVGKKYGFINRTGTYIKSD